MALGRWCARCSAPMAQPRRPAGWHFKGSTPCRSPSPAGPKQSRSWGRAATADVEHWPYVRHRVPQSFVRTGVALIGDAVHAMPPSLAQGASLTLEDAWVLSRELARTAELGGALRSYQRQRRWRVSLLSAIASRKVAQEADGPWLRGPRHLLRRLLGS